MSRWQVQIVQMRARDIKVGDVVAKDSSRFDGWFRVHEVKHLGDGSINLLDKANVRSFIAGPFDLVGLQTPIPLPVEAERNARREEASRAGSQMPDSPADDQAASREAAAREAIARGESDGPARALPQ